MSVNNIAVWNSRKFDFTVGCVAAGSSIEVLAKVLGPKINTVFLLVKTLNNGRNVKGHSGRKTTSLRCDLPLQGCNHSFFLLPILMLDLD